MGVNMTGKVLWYDNADGYGIIVAKAKGKVYEIYFDSSTINGTLPQDNDRVEFDLNREIKDCLTAKNVEVA
jgi:cold shock CspA family protein